MWGLLSSASMGLTGKGLALPLLGAGLIALSAGLAYRDYTMREAGAARAELARLEDVARENQKKAARLKAGYTALRRAERKAERTAAEADRKARSDTPQENLPICPVDCLVQ